MVSRIHRRQVNKNPETHPLGHWSERQKYEAVTTYLLVGKWPIVSDQTKVPIDTLKKWKQMGWWKEMEEEIRTASRIEMGSNLNRIVNKAASVVEDRLEHGELIYNPESKKFTRRPVGAKVASDIMTKSIDRQVLLDKIIEQPVVREEAILDRLKSIEQALKRASSKRTSSNEIIDVTPIPVPSLPDLASNGSSDNQDSQPPADPSQGIQLRGDGDQQAGIESGGGSLQGADSHSDSPAHPS